MIINETDNRNRCVLVVADLGLDWRNDLLGLETVVSSGMSIRDWDEGVFRARNHWTCVKHFLHRVPRI